MEKVGDDVLNPLLQKAQRAVPLPGEVDPEAFLDDAELVVVSAGATVRGREAIARTLHTFFRESFSETAEAVQTALLDGRHAACEWRFSGTHTGWLDGIAPTGKHVVLPLTAFYDLEDDGIRCVRLYYDTRTLLRQLGYA